MTGGAGFIGSHVCKLLADEGYCPVTLDNLSSGHQRFVQWGPFLHGNICSANDLDHVFHHYNPVAVFHLAADIEVGNSVENPDPHYRNNMVGMLELLSTMRRWKVDKLVFASTCAVYGSPETQPIREDEPLAPASPYGHGKAMCERLIEDFASAYGLRAANLRFFNASGASPEIGLGEARRHETHLIPLALDAVLAAETFTVNGNDYDTHDGTCVRDYLHVEDIALAHFQALKALDRCERGTAALYNLSTGQGYSVLDVLKAIERVTGQPVSWRVGPRRPGDVARLVGDASLATRDLNWQPARSSIDSIVGSAWEWRRHYHGKLWSEASFTISRSPA
ncbi:UDP-glucose 4-epimerase [Salinisphaera sp. PC39]